MTKGKLIAIEGTDCSGKETQTNLLIKRLREEKIQVQNFSFPNYNSPTGKIIGGAYLGKEYISPSLFEEGTSKVDPKVASLYYAADRKYNIDKILFLIENSYNVILDRYVYSNMAHQGGKIYKKKDRIDMYKFLDNLEFKLLDLPKPDITVFLHMPYKAALELKKNRKESPDLHENDKKHLIMAEKSYFELSKKYSFKVVNCSIDDKPRDIKDINDEIYDIIKPLMTR